MPNEVPFEVVAGPVTLYYGDPGATYPLIDVEPSAPTWTKIGTNGVLNYDGDEGVNINHEDSVQAFRSLGDTGKRKVWRDTEDSKVSLLLVDYTLEQYMLAINRNAVTTVAAGVGTAGYKWMGLNRGFSVDTVALLIRGTGISPYGENFNIQYEFWRGAQSGKPSVKFLKAKPIGLMLEWDLLVDPTKPTTQSTGRILMQHAEANT